MKSVHEGDTLVWKLDRLARSARQLIDTVDALRERGAAFRSLTDALDTTTPRARLAFHIFGGGRGYARRSEPSESPRSRRARCMLGFATHWARRTETASAVLGRLHRRPRRGSCASLGFYEASKLSSLREEPREEGCQPPSWCENSDAIKSIV
jgi:hypothetical protein